MMKQANDLAARVRELEATVKELRLRLKGAGFVVAPSRFWDRGKGGAAYRGAYVSAWRGEPSDQPYSNEPHRTAYVHGYRDGVAAFEKELKLSSA